MTMMLSADRRAQGGPSERRKAPPIARRGPSIPLEIPLFAWGIGPGVVGGR